MTASIFTDKSVEPSESQVAEALGNTYSYWAELEEHLEDAYGPLTAEWKIYSKKSGWVRKTLKKKRNLFFFMPLDGFFHVGFVFGDRAVAAIEESDLPDEIKDELRKARKYAEGRGLVVEVRTTADLEHTKTLVDYKLKH